METVDHRPLRTAGLLFAAGFTVHNADHVRRGIDAITNEVNSGGLVVAMASAVLLTLVATRHALAPFAAAAGGLAIAVGVSLTHLLPDWGVLSDPLPGGDVDAFTWAAVLAEIAGAVGLGVVGLRIVRRQGYLVQPEPATASGA
ncbi:hypothetical protein HC251_04025 [Iamia sp. SCSIO 61187]|uniref:hypothetical protein n=1 Tax=Iamia sp. SCSIO 61187 TaxID=2722752 RepID=UPI001C627CD2|nr:hypothetical protein [Iamia sp. SCSIO 61187]QYG91687.1 hypothetical protein HC251_04025 [Iamia sp. SCSIO 61187]